MTFKDLKLEAPILKALEKQGYSQPTPIQEQAIPILLKGHDLAIPFSKHLNARRDRRFA